MSADGIVGFANPVGAPMMRALADTVGMDPPEQAAFWLEKIATKLHRGPRVDTWASARDRAAKFAKIKPSMAERIWHRWQDMKDVSGGALLKLMIAYEAVHQAEQAGNYDYQNSSAASARLPAIIAAVRQVEHGQVGD